MKTALVLEGGGMRGIYTAGVIDILLENNIEVDAVFGVSAGALFGINYLSKQKGRVLRYNKKYVNDKNYMGFYSLLKTGNIMNKEFCFDKLVYELDKFDFDEYNKSNTDFYAVVTNVETGKAEYKNIKDLEKDMEYLRASGSMPIVSKMVNINNKLYLDGAIGDSIPVLKAKEMGYEKVIVVLTRELEFRKKPSKMFVYNLFYKKYPKFLKSVSNRYINYNDTLDKIIELEKTNDVFVLRPSIPPKISRIEKDVKKIEELYNLGKKDMLDKLGSLKKYIKS